MVIVPALFTQAILEQKHSGVFSVKKSKLTHIKVKIEFWKIEKTGKYIKRYIMIQR